MSVPVRVMIERGRKKPVAVAVAFDWPGWDRNGRSEADALAVLAAYRPRYARVAGLAGLEDAFAATGRMEVKERVEGIGMTDYYGLSGRTAGAEQEPMTEAECERKIALLRACWAYFDDVASRVSAELRKGPRGGGRDRDAIIRHTYGAEVVDFAKKVGVISPPETWQRPTPEALLAHRDAVSAAIRDHNGRGTAARSWTVAFLIRRCAYHLLDHAWEMEDKDLSTET